MDGNHTEGTNVENALRYVSTQEGPIRLSVGPLVRDSDVNAMKEQWEDAQADGPRREWNVFHVALRLQPGEELREWVWEAIVAAYVRRSASENTVWGAWLHTQGASEQQHVHILATDPIWIGDAATKGFCSMWEGALRDELEGRKQPDPGEGCTSGRPHRIGYEVEPDWVKRERDAREQQREAAAQEVVGLRVRTDFSYVEGVPNLEDLSGFKTETFQEGLRAEKEAKMEAFKREIQPWIETRELPREAMQKEWKKSSTNEWTRSWEGIELVLHREPWRWVWRATVELGGQIIEISGAQESDVPTKPEAAETYQNAAELGVTSTLVAMRDDANNVANRLLDMSTAEKT